MKTTAIPPHGYLLSHYGLVNCFLVREPDGFTLIDTNLKGCAPAILAAASTVGAPIRRILLTHAHVDHVGSIDALAAALPGVPIATSERSLPLLRQPPDKSLRPTDAPGKITGGLPGIATVPNQILAEGDRIGSLLAISTPGHIPGQLSFLDERDGTLYAGDTFLAIFHLGVSGFRPWWFPLRICQSLPTALESARHLRDYPIQRFACGHGPVREGGRKILKAAIVRAESY